MNKFLLFSIIFVISNYFFLNADLFDGTQGVGTTDDPYRIYTIGDLKELADNVNNGPLDPTSNITTGKYFSLQNNISTPLEQSIGWINSAGQSKSFSGVF
jgi:hypothetical protein